MFKKIDFPEIKPIIAKKKAEPFDDPEWSFEFKYDGFRAVMYLADGKGFIKSRNGKILSRFDPLCQEIARELKVKNVIFDGEVVTLDETNRPIFEDLVKNTRKPVYIAFDILWLEGQDLRSLSLSERRKYLKKVLPKKSEVVLKPLISKGHGKKFFELLCAHDLEGIVGKKESDPYEHYVTWYKIKNKNYSQLNDIRKNFNFKKSNI